MTDQASRAKIPEEAPARLRTQALEGWYRALADRADRNCKKCGGCGWYRTAQYHMPTECTCQLRKATR